jgi:circadian clock protein KaiC
MSSGKMSLKRLSTGVPGLDEVLGGGLPEYSFNLLAGSPGCGKTTLVHQFTFANASPERPAIYFTVVGEPPLKMLRYQQQMDFFDGEKAGTAIRFVDLSPEVLTGDLARVLDKIVDLVEASGPAIVVVDSFRTVLRAKRGSDSELELQGFLQRLAVHLTTWQVTSFLIGEYGEEELHDNPVFTVADGIVWLTQAREGNAVVRKLEVMKMRGAATLPGLHTFRINSGGIQIFPRKAPSEGRTKDIGRTRCKTGVDGLDAMMGGGILQGDITLAAGPSGIGKSMLATHFISEGLKEGERCVLAVFEEHPQDYLWRATQMGFDLEGPYEKGTLKLLSLRPLDLSADELLYQVQQAVSEVGASRLVIDSLNGVELALSPTFREDFRESLYRVVGHLSRGGVSLMLTVEIVESFEDIRFSPHAISFLAQNVLLLRYVEIESRLRRMLAVVKMRRSRHSTVMREFEIGARGLVMLDPLSEYQGILSGVARRRLREDSVERGLTRRESMLLQLLRTMPGAPLAQVASASGRGEEEVSRDLERLIELDYARKGSEEEREFFEAVDKTKLR